MKLIFDNKVDRYVLKSGWLYIVVDSAYPEWFKFGRSSNLPLRLKQYNKDCPEPTASVMLVSQKFFNVHKAEETILTQIFNMGIRPSPGTREWFPIEHKPTVMRLVDTLEEEQRRKWEERHEK